MGINRDIILNGDVEIKNSYLKLIEIEFNEISNRISYRLMSFKDELSRQKGLNNHLDINFDNNFINFNDEYFVKIQKLYDEIRTLVYEYEELKNKDE